MRGCPECPDFQRWHGSAAHDDGGLPGGARFRPPRPADRADRGVAGAIGGMDSFRRPICGSSAEGGNGCELVVWRGLGAIQTGYSTRADARRLLR